MKKQPTIAEMQKQVKELELQNSCLIQELTGVKSAFNQVKARYEAERSRVERLIDSNLNQSKK